MTASTSSGKCTCAPIQAMARVLFNSKNSNQYYAWGCPVHDPLAMKPASKKDTK